MELHLCVFWVKFTKDNWKGDANQIRPEMFLFFYFVSAAGGDVAFAVVVIKWIKSELKLLGIIMEFICPADMGLCPQRNF